MSSSDNEIENLDENVFYESVQKKSCILIDDDEDEPKDEVFIDHLAQIESYLNSPSPPKIFDLVCAKCDLNTNSSSSSIVSLKRPSIRRSTRTNSLEWDTEGN